MTAYQELEARKKRVSALNNAMGILHWDQQTMMPDGAAPARASVLAELSVMQHEMETGSALSDLIDRGRIGVRPTRCLATRQPARDPPPVHPCQCDAR